MIEKYQKEKIFIRFSKGEVKRFAITGRKEQRKHQVQGNL